jgi:hypothetical protein
MRFESKTNTRNTRRVAVTWPLSARLVSRMLVLGAVLCGIAGCEYEGLALANSKDAAQEDEMSGTTYKIPKSKITSVRTLDQYRLGGYRALQSASLAPFALVAAAPASVQILAAVRVPTFVRLSITAFGGASTVFIAGRPFSAAVVFTGLANGSVHFPLPTAPVIYELVLLPGESLNALATLAAVVWVQSSSIEQGEE